MKIEIKIFGNILVSRPSGQEALATILSQNVTLGENEGIELDFSDVSVVAPGWLDEVYSGLRDQYGDRVKIVPTQNITVIESMNVIQSS